GRVQRGQPLRPVRAGDGVHQVVAAGEAGQLERPGGGRPGPVGAALGLGEHVRGRHRRAAAGDGAAEGDPGPELEAERREAEPPSPDIAGAGEPLAAVSPLPEAMTRLAPRATPGTSKAPDSSATTPRTSRASPALTTTAAPPA